MLKKVTSFKMTVKGIIFYCILSIYAYIPLNDAYFKKIKNDIK